MDSDLDQCILSFVEQRIVDLVQRLPVDDPVQDDGIPFILRISTRVFIISIVVDARFLIASTF